MISNGTVIRRLTSGTGTLLAAMSATLAAEVVWTVRRPLPTQIEPDPSTAEYSTHVERAPLRVVALGDSTLTGPGLARHDQIWLRQAFGRLAHEQPVELFSLAAGGSRVADTVELIPDVLALAPDLVVVAVGANDALHTLAVRRVRSDFHRLVGGLLEGVAVVGVSNLGDLGNIPRILRPLSDVMRLRAVIIRSVIERVVAEHERAVLLDVTAADPVLRDRSIFTPDLFHPGESGHSAWADAVLPDLQVAIDRAIAESQRCTRVTGPSQPDRSCGPVRPSTLRVDERTR